MHTEEQVVLLNDEGTAVGSASKRHVHTDSTPLHLAFSCYLFNDTGQVLMTRRAISKRTWPGVWTNSFCGHPAPDETFSDAIVRRGREELGAEVSGIDIVDADFRYRAVDASGVVENEICPVHVARLTSPLDPNPDEVADWAWVSLDELAGALTRTPFVFSPWLVLQLPHIIERHSPLSR